MESCCGKDQYHSSQQYIAGYIVCSTNATGSAQLQQCIVGPYCVAYLPSQYIYQDSNLLASHIFLIRFLPGKCGAKIMCAVHVALIKRPINKLKLDRQSRQLVLKAHCPDIYTELALLEMIGSPKSYLMLPLLQSIK